MKTRKPRLTTKVFLTLEDIKILETLLAKEHELTLHSIASAYHTHISRLAYTLAEAAEDLDF
jgi:hypothetical protein